VFDPGKVGNHDFLLVDIQRNERIGVEQYVTATREGLDLRSELGSCQHARAPFSGIARAVDRSGRPRAMKITAGRLRLKSDFTQPGNGHYQNTPLSPAALPQGVNDPWLRDVPRDAEPATEGAAPGQSRCQYSAAAYNGAGGR
jgi:hypothetical protein